MPTFTDAWAEAQTTNTSMDCINTLELQHIKITEDDVPVPIRIVNHKDDQQLTIEPGAAFNGGEEVTFKAIPFFASDAQFAEGKMPETSVTIDNVSREMADHLKEMVKVRADLIVIFRQYQPDDTSEPSYGPVQFVMRNIVVTGTSVTGKAQLDDYAHTRFPRKNYRDGEL